MNEYFIIKIQKWYRGCIYRIKKLPLILYIIKKSLINTNLILSNINSDGRINSSLNEDKIIQILIDIYGKRIYKPRIRMWYDLLVYDYYYGWIPINIKTTTMDTADNIGNLATCVYAYTDTIIDIHSNKTFDNDKMSCMLFNKLKNKNYNYINKRDYYFIVINKNNSKDIVINSLKGLNLLTPNLSNLPFQVYWNKNRDFKYYNINTVIIKFIKCLQKPKQHWKEIFMKNIRSLEIN